MGGSGVRIGEEELMYSNMKMLRQMLLLVWILSPFSLAAQHSAAASNPCEERPRSQRVLNECAAFEYKQADARLSKVYEKAMQYLTDDRTRAEKEKNQSQINYEQAGIDGLKDAESAWANYRDLQCRAAGQRYEGGSMRPMVQSLCMKTLTEHRIADLKSIYERSDQKLE
jgi:uncharacterized protein YecT (DUF1311 family)